MQTSFRPAVGFMGGLLVLGALGTLGFLTAIATPVASVNFKNTEVLAQAQPVKEDVPPAGVFPVEAALSPDSFPRELVVKWERPTSSAPRWLDALTDQNELEESIRSALEQRLDIDFNAVPLSRAMEFISEKMGFTIILDDKALEEENITPDEPITLKRSNVKVRDALQQILAPLQLTHKIDLEGLVITARRTSANIVRAYDLSFVFPDTGLVQELIAAIETMVNPTDWQMAGGNSAIRTVGCVMLVFAPEDTQLSIAQLLREIGKQTPANMKPRLFQRGLQQSPPVEKPKQMPAQPPF